MSYSQVKEHGRQESAILFVKLYIFIIQSTCMCEIVHAYTHDPRYHVRNDNNDRNYRDTAFFPNRLHTCPRIHLIPADHIDLILRQVVIHIPLAIPVILFHTIPLSGAYVLEIYIFNRAVTVGYGVPSVSGSVTVVILYFADNGSA